MNNGFSKLANSVLSRALSRFSSKPATSLSSKAKAAIGLGGLAGAGALAHHYDMLPGINKTYLKYDDPFFDTSSRSASNARKVLQELSKDTEEISASVASKPVKAVRTYNSKLRPYMMDFIRSGATIRESDGYTYSSPRVGLHEADLDRALSDARYSVLSPQHEDMPFKPWVEKELLSELITARDGASFKNKNLVVEGINERINSILDVLNSDGARQATNYDYNAREDRIFTHDNPDRSLVQLLNYDLNPWGATNATDIPIDLERGRLFEDDIRMGIRVPRVLRDNFEPQSLDSIIGGLDYDSAAKQLNKGKIYYRIPPHHVSYNTWHDYRMPIPTPYQPIGMTNDIYSKDYVLLDKIPRLKKN